MGNTSLVIRIVYFSTMFPPASLTKRKQPRRQRGTNEHASGLDVLVTVSAYEGFPKYCTLIILRTTQQVRSIIILIEQLSQLKHRAVSQSAPGHTVRAEQGCRLPWSSSSLTCSHPTRTYRQKMYLKHCTFHLPLLFFKSLVLPVALHFSLHSEYVFLPSFAHFHLLLHRGSRNSPALPKARFPPR